MDQQVEQLAVLNPGQALAATTLNTIQTLAYEDINPSVETHQRYPIKGSPSREK